MKLAFWSLVCTSVISADVYTVFAKLGSKPSTGNIVPNRFIIELDSLSDIPSRRNVVSREVSASFPYIL